MYERDRDIFDGDFNPITSSAGEAVCVSNNTGTGESVVSTEDEEQEGVTIVVSEDEEVEDEDEDDPIRDFIEATKEDGDEFIRNHVSEASQTIMETSDFVSLDIGDKTLAYYERRLQEAKLPFVSLSMASILAVEIKYLPALLKVLEYDYSTKIFIAEKTNVHKFVFLREIPSDAPNIYFAPSDRDYFGPGVIDFLKDSQSLQNLLEATGKNLTISNSHGYTADTIRKDDQNFHINFHGASSFVRKSKRTINDTVDYRNTGNYSVFGTQIPRESIHTMMHFGTGFVVTDSNEVPLLEFKKGCIYILFDLGYKMFDGLEDIINNIILLYLDFEKNLPAEGKVCTDTLKEEKEQALISYFADINNYNSVHRVKPLLDDLRFQEGNLTETRKRISKLMIRAQEYEKVIIEMKEKLLELGKIKAGEGAAYENEMIAGLRNMELINKVEVVSGDILQLYTEDLKITHEEKIYNMGSYLITIYKTGEALRFSVECVKGDITYLHKYPHPFVSTNFEVCFGTVESSMYSLMSEGEITVAVTLLLEFLQTYNGQEAFVSLKTWPTEAV